MAGKKGMRQRAWGSLRKLPSGKWQASYIGPDLARHKAPITYSTRMDAEHWLADERRRIERDEWVAPKVREEVQRAKSKTLGEYATEWLATRPLKPRTKIGYEATYNQRIKPKLGSVPLSALNAETVRRWHAGLGNTHTTRNAHAYGLLHAICATAVTDGLLTTQPCQIARAMNVPTKRAAVILDVDDIGKLANAIQPERLKTLVLISAWCGLRYGEVSELRRKDFAADCSTITVSRAVTHRQKTCNIDTPKSGKGRTVVVPPHIRDDLKHHLAYNVKKDAEAQLFPASKGGCHLNDRVFLDYFTAALKAIGREGVRVHDLRHFAGTQTARVGNLVETMARLGHSTVKASLIYQQIVSGRDAEVAEALSALATSRAAEELAKVAAEADAETTRKTA
ncbi:integrase [Mycobacterium sp. E2462]|uniref:tyrosine-type recombinase/integrase n=1 Tax=Mycobacterium sp. E2462 TaxID=1834133 RepID=UPI000801BFB2|nr:site-specific integrase [Mycobacterium sp. E2462]OBI12345.1 integrase [Mycobacterium sp. E2462]